MSRLQRLSRDTASKGVVLNEVEFYRCVTHNNFVSVSCQNGIKVKIGLHTCMYIHIRAYIRAYIHTYICKRGCVYRRVSVFRHR